ncbi:hypothetical protein [Zestomonas carbonaria]|uniref:Uncharacterized protein n=1 Tax=Zestomonas carbonaria TaxID=2762745 RepID=A0A7U7ETQ1_9GAMM|nr:hypothetical protein [Pseudomonas carbonaria]CAD5110450.1 hypothetical protein PSEWESI4_04773 [Pseudomonas carbonaria]
MHNKLSKTAIAISLAIAAGHSAQAALYAVDPGPYLEENGKFAAWYQDTHGRVLDLCLSKAISSRSGGDGDGPAYMCSFPPLEEGFDVDQPIVFPSNFPGESFWFTADAEIADAASGIELRYGAALEAAFAVEEPAEGDQVAFARIRVRVDVPQPGLYTVTHPYGVEVFDVTQEIFDDTEGDRAINMTRDLGIGAPYDYTGALNGDLGPFLRSVNGPYTEGSETFIGDPNLEEPVTGSPFDTNYVRIEGPNGIDLRTNLFAISGKLSSVVRETPVIVQRATYSRSSGGSGVVAQQDVFVQAPPPPATASYVDTAGLGIPMSEANGTGNWYGQSASNPTTLPGQLSLTANNQPAIPTSTPTTVTPALVDLVQIRRAEYSLSSGQITLEATTSDQTAPPTLTAVGIGTLSGSGATKTLTTGISPIPPAFVQVTSANGGSDTEEVVILP